MLILIAAVAGWSGCKKRTTIQVPKAILQAKSATPAELLQIVNRLDGIQTLKASNIKAEYTSEKKEGSLIELEKYPKAPGYILLKRPDSLRLVIQNPVVKNKEISLVSEGDEFRVWVHGRRKFYIGKNSSEKLISEDLEEDTEIPIRAGHIFEAIFPVPIPLDDSDLGYAVIEEEDAQAKYYVLTVNSIGSFPRILSLRQFWIERAGLTISRQRIFNDDGQVVSDIHYSDPVQIDKYALPRKINIERSLDGYTLELEIKNWVVNPVFKDDTFSLEPVEGVKVIRFK
jgi:outer membrane lipoprotein-sorting protein